MKFEDIIKMWRKIDGRMDGKVLPYFKILYVYSLWDKMNVCIANDADRICSFSKYELCMDHLKTEMGISFIINEFY